MPANVATLHDLNLERSVPESYKLFHQVQDLTRCLQQKSSASAPALVLFLKGYLTPEWMIHVGFACGIDPEFWLRHFRYRYSLAKSHYFSDPALPSSASNVVRLRVPSIGYRADSSVQSQAYLEYLRGVSNEALQEYVTGLASGADVKAGDSLVRDFAVHDEAHFSVHQDLSLCVNDLSSGWIAVVWSDFGSGLSNGPPGPWSSPQLCSHPWATSIYPTLIHKSNVALKTQHFRRNAEVDVPRDGTLQQSATALPANYGSFQEPRLAAQSPLYAILELFDFKASAEQQFLNMIDRKISDQLTHPAGLKATGMPLSDRDNASRSWSKWTVWQRVGDARVQAALEEQHASASSNLLHCKSILDRRLGTLRENIRFLENGGDQNWPRPSTLEAQAQVKSSTDHMLQVFVHLLVKTEALLTKCERGIDNTGANAMILESRIAVLQARRVNRLTLLGALFLPAAFTFGFFGMNFAELGQDNLSIWVWIAVLIPIYCLVLLFLFGTRRRLPDETLPLYTKHEATKVDNFTSLRKLLPGSMRS